MDKERMLEWAKSFGFSDGAIASADCMVYKPEFRASCEENRCGGYDKRWSCPPGAGEPEALIEKAKAFENVLFLDYTHPLEDCFDYEGMMEGSRVHGEITQNLADDAVEKLDEPYLILGHSFCRLCDSCSYPDAPCRHPDRVVVSLSAYCVFVGESARNCGLKYYTGDDTVHYFTAILFGRKKS